MDIRKALLIFAGTLCVGLGVLGMFLPLMPTTVFLLMAAYCYSKSSEKFHTWLLSNRLFGKYISNYNVSDQQRFWPIEIMHPYPVAGSNKWTFTAVVAGRSGVIVKGSGSEGYVNNPA